MSHKFSEHLMASGTFESYRTRVMAELRKLGEDPNLFNTAPEIAIMREYFNGGEEPDHCAYYLSSEATRLYR